MKSSLSDKSNCVKFVKTELGFNAFSSYTEILRSFCKEYLTIIPAKAGKTSKIRIVLFKILFSDGRLFFFPSNKSLCKCALNKLKVTAPIEVLTNYGRETQGTAVIRIAYNYFLTCRHCLYF